jgi:Zn finger protein HypA/HybF involved in hydrogenase expression
MHDSVIAQSILRDLEKEGKVKKAYIEVGELFGIDPEHLLEHLKDVSKIKFEVKQSLSVVECEDCGFRGRANIIERLHDMVLYDCPSCSGQVSVISGDKIIIKKVEK